MASVGKKGLALAAALLIGVLLSFAGCAQEVAHLLSGSEGFSISGEPTVADEAFVRPPPTVVVPTSAETNVVTYTSSTGSTASLDLSNISQGYIVASCMADTNVVVLVSYTGQDSAGTNMVRESHYIISNDGQGNILPLPESGYQYTVSLNVEIAGSPGTYSRYLEESFFVTLESEFAPFLIPNMLVDYDGNSDIVGFSYELSMHSRTKLEIAQQIYYWITNNVVYDDAKAAAVIAGTLFNYNPLPDRTLAELEGICYDYASLAAAMLRANGIPCKLVKGMARSGSREIYHAWNEIWLEETGWIAVSIPATPEEWLRIDTTFAAGGASGSIIGDENNYLALTYH